MNKRKIIFVIPHEFKQYIKKSRHNETFYYFPLQISSLIVSLKIKFLFLIKLQAHLFISINFSQ